MKHALLLGTLLTLAAIAKVARADDEVASTELFNAGRDLMKRGDFAAACPKLAESVRLKATVGALGKLAACEEHEGRLVSAYGRWKQALNLARSAGDDRAADAEREIARLDRVVPKLVVGAAAALPAGTAIRVDDATFSPASVGVALAVEPGAHRIEATAPGYRPWSTTLQAASDGATSAVSIPALEPLPATAQAPVPPSEPVPEPLPPSGPGSSPSPGSPWPTVGLVGAGVGLAAVAAGGAFGFVALSQRNAAHCQGTLCPNDPSAATLNGAKNVADWSTGLLIGGGVLAASGVVLWLSSRDGHGAGARIGLAPAPGGLALRGGW